MCCQLLDIIQPIERTLKQLSSTLTVRFIGYVADIKQGASELAAQYMARVIKLLDDMKFIAPTQLTELATPWSDAFKGGAGWAAITAAQKTMQMQRLLRAGAEDAYNLMGCKFSLLN